MGYNISHYGQKMLYTKTESLSLPLPLSLSLSLSDKSHLKLHHKTRPPARTPPPPPPHTHTVTYNGSNYQYSRIKYTLNQLRSLLIGSALNTVLNRTRAVFLKDSFEPVHLRSLVRAFTVSTS